MIHQLFDGKFVTTTFHHPRPILSVEYVNPFIESVNSVLETMLNCSTKRHGLVIKESKTPRYLLSALIDVTGQSDGLVVLSLSRNAAVGVLQRMLGKKASLINEDVRDAVGELANVICGTAKAKLEHLELSIGIPKMLAGRNHILDFPVGVLPLSILFESDIGPFAIEVGFSEPYVAPDTGENEAACVSV